MKQTAVEWLIEEIKPFLSMPIEDAYKTILQAKEMEKQQIIDAYDAGLFDGTMDDINDRMHKQYYNETYGSKGSDDHIVDTNEMVSSQTENKGLDWLVNRWKKLQAKGEKMSWNQIIQITELAKELPSSQTEISDEEITKLANEHILYNDSKRQWVIEGMKLYREQLKQRQ